jgi:hypothetical protein
VIDLQNGCLVPSSISRSKMFGPVQYVDLRVVPVPSDRCLEKLLTLIHDFFLRLARHVGSWLCIFLALIIVINGRSWEPDTCKHKETGNYDAECMLTSRPVSDLEKCWRLIFVVQCTRHGCMSSWSYHVLRFNSVVSQYVTIVPMRDVQACFIYSSSPTYVRVEFRRTLR